MKILGVVRTVKNKLDMAYERKRRIESALEKSTPRLDILPGENISSDRIGLLIAMKIELEARIDLLHTVLVDCQVDLIAIVVRCCKSELVQSVLLRRYGMLEEYQEIAEHLNISVRQVYRLHKVGVNKLMRTV